MITLARGEPTWWGEIQGWFIIHEEQVGWGILLIMAVLIFSSRGRR